MTDFVLDASVTMAWCFEDEATSYTEAVLDRLWQKKAMTAAIWPYEVANVLLLAERRSRITQAQRIRFIDLLGAMPIAVDLNDPTQAWTEVVALARTHGLTAYDACYLELAARHGLPLASLDASLLRACRAAGVAVIADSS